jgi:hypothetical protein
MRKQFYILLLTVLLSSVTTELPAQYVFTASGRLIRSQEALNPKQGSLTFLHTSTLTPSQGHMLGR